MDENKEVWRNVAGHGDIEISNHGRVRRSFGLVKVNTSGKYPTCWSPTRKNNIAVHRLVADAFLSNPDDKPEVNHKDGVKDNNRVENLEWVTRKENVIHSVKTGLRPPRDGEKAGGSKLTDDRVMAMRREAHAMHNTDLARKYGVSRSCVSMVLRGKTWTHLPVEEYGNRLYLCNRAIRPEVIEQFWNLLLRGYKQYEAAKAVGIAKSLASRIVNNKVYTEVTEKLPPLNR